MTTRAKPRAPADGREPLAIIGLGCRFPGGASGPDALWSMLSERRTGLGEVPPDRWDHRRYHDPDRDTPGKMYVREGAFLREPITAFDPLAFGISPREAEHMDPQQRLLLETTWEALDDAGRSQESLRGQDVGVFVGGFTLDNMGVQFAYENQHLISSHSATSASHTMLANRISHVFDLRGPSLSVDTACSSSLTAFHLACRSLWAGECSLAIVGGVNAILRPGFMVAMCKGGFLAPDGRCKTFQAAADGYARGEGAGVTILAPLSAARGAGDRVYAAALASATNQDGRTPGVSQPSKTAQVALLRRVVDDAGVDPAELRYVEAHGTGTQAGDAAEAGALSEVLAAGRAPGDELVVGALKQNLGHLEAAAGVAGVIKTSLALYHREVPGNAQASDPNPNIPLADMGLEFSAEPRRLEGDERILAGVNSFGYGGANAHAILTSVAPGAASSADNAPGVDQAPPDASSAFAIPLSARDQAALETRARDLGAFVAQRASVSIADVAHTLVHKSSHHDHRAVVVASDRDELVGALGAMGAGSRPPQAVTGRAAAEPSPIVFAYTGMGPQWWAMGRELAASEPIYAEAIEEIDALFFERAGWSIAEALAANEADSEISRTRVAQPTNFALQIALTRLLRSWGIEPAAVVGHSVGEVAAAHVSGALSLEDAVYLSYHRSRLQQAMAMTGGEARGAMLAAGLDGAAAGELAREVGGVAIAAENAPGSVTLSGDERGIDEIARRLEAEGIFHRRLDVEVAYHSHHMEPLRQPLLSALRDLEASVPRLPFFSTVTGHLWQEPLNAAYFCRNMREPVLFERAVRSLAQAGFRTFVEVGPHPVLRTGIAQTLRDAGDRGTILATLHRKQPERRSLLHTLGELYTAGHPVRMGAVAPAGGTFVRLPAYPFQRRELWIESEASRALVGAVAEDRAGQAHPLLQFAEAAPAPRWRSDLSSQFLPWLSDHRIKGDVVVPAAGYLEAALAAAREVLRDDAAQTDTECEAVALEDVDFRQLLVVEDGRVADLYIECDPDSRRFSIASAHRGGRAFSRHADGRMAPAPGARDWAEVVDVTAAERRLGGAGESPAQHYAAMRRRGLEYGPSFRAIERVVGPRAEGGFAEVLVKLRAPARGGEPDRYLAHPALVDGALQAAALLADDQIGGAGDDTPWIPVAVDRLILAEPLSETVWALVQRTRRSAGEVRLDIRLFGDDGRVRASLAGVSLQPLFAAGERPVQSGYYGYAWRQLPEPERSSGAAGDERPGQMRAVAVAGEARDVEPLAAALERAGATCEKAPLGAGEGLGELAREHHARLERAVVVVPDERHGPVAALEELGSQLVGLARALAAREAPPGLAIVVPSERRWGAALVGEALAGLLRVIRAEVPAIDTRAVTAAPKDGRPDWDRLAAELTARDGEPEIRLEPGARAARRLVRAEVTADDAPDEVELRTNEAAVELTADRRGALGSAHHRVGERRAPADSEVEIRVLAAAINFKDVLKLAGQIDPRALRDTYFDEALGMECAGVVETVGAKVGGLSPGDRVIALPGGGCFKSYVTAPADAVDKLPRGLSPAEGAGLIIPYLTAWHSLCEVACVQPGETVLVHNAAGGVGLAAIQVAKLRDARVLATAGTEEKRDRVRKIGADAVFDSRSLAFSHEVERWTSGRGVDVVLGAMSGDMLNGSLRILRRYGRCVDLGKRAQVEAENLPLRPFNEAITYAAVDMDRRLRDRPAACRRVIDTVLEHVEAGRLPPIPARAFPASEAVSALRTMAQAEHVGRLVLDYDGAVVRARRPRSEGSAPIAPGGTYVVTGGLGGFGLEVARWLARNGAGGLLLLGRRGADTPGADAAAAEIEAHGARVLIRAVDVADERSLGEALAAARKELPPIRGVFHAAMVLGDRRLEDMDAETFRRVVRPKALGAWHLHRLTERDPLDHFVLFSSVAVAIGNPGQSNYVAAGALLDALARLRRRRGQPATSVQWGVIAGAGVADREGMGPRLEAAGMAPLPVDDALTGLGHVLTGRLAGQEDGPAGVFEIDWERLAEHSPEQASAKLFAEVRQHSGSVGGARVRAAIALLAHPPGAWPAVLEAELAERAADILRVEKDQIDPQRSFTDLGVDSLGAAELATALSSAGYPIREMDVMRGAAISSLAEALAGRLTEALAGVKDELLAQPDALEDAERARLTEIFEASREEDAQ